VRVADVERALVDAGEPALRHWVEGFVVEHLDGTRLKVSWRAPAELDAPGLELFHLERYAAILRSAGICAMLVLDSPRSWVICVPAGDASRAGEVDGATGARSTTARNSPTSEW
jgi:hypothetical protein